MANNEATVEYTKYDDLMKPYSILEQTTLQEQLQVELDDIRKIVETPPEPQQAVLPDPERGILPVPAERLCGSYDEEDICNNVDKCEWIDPQGSNPKYYKNLGCVPKVPRGLGQFVLPDDCTLYVFGDIHCDLGLLETLLCDVTGLITINRKTTPPTYRWIADNSWVVLVGDMMDRFRPSETVQDNGKTEGEVKDEEGLIINLLNILSVQANQKNSRIIKLIGNHELMLLNGDSRYVTDFAKYNILAQNTNHTEIFAPRGPYSTKLMEGLGYGMAQIKVGYKEWVFVHGGIMEPIITHIQQEKKKPNVIDYINQTVRGMFDGTIELDGQHSQLLLLEEDLLDEWKPRDKQKTRCKRGIVATDKPCSPFWDRRFGTENSEIDIKILCNYHLNATFKGLGITNPNNGRLVVAHCVQDGRLFSNKHTIEPIESTKDINKTVYGPEIKEQKKGQKNEISVGINCQCPEMDHLVPLAPLVPRLWRIDCGMSRAFDSQQMLGILAILEDPKTPKEKKAALLKKYVPLLKKDYNIRRPQCLKITKDETVVLKSNYDLRRTISHKQLEDLVIDMEFKPSTDIKDTILNNNAAATPVATPEAGGRRRTRKNRNKLSRKRKKNNSRSKRRKTRNKRTNSRRTHKNRRHRRKRNN